MKDNATDRNAAATFVVAACERDETGALGRTVYRHEAWPCMVREGEWMEIGGNDEEVIAVRYRRTEDGRKFVLVDIEIEYGHFDNLGALDGWCDSPEEALNNQPV